MYDVWQGRVGDLENKLPKLSAALNLNHFGHGGAWRVRGFRENTSEP